MSESTEVGSIVGKLKIDSSDWDRELTRAEVKANQLGRSNPTIQVDADTGKAIGQLAAVEVAEKKVAASSNEVAAGNRKVDSTAKQAGGSMHLLYSSLAMLAPAAVPLAATAAAAGAAFGAMGLAGILAVVGVKNAMQDGTRTGDQYAAGIGELKTEFRGLAQTGAEGALEGFNRGVSALRSYMPFLNGEVSVFSRVLGNVAADGLTGVLGMFQTLDPVIRGFAGYLGDLSERFSTIGDAPGLHSFVEYAITTMPQVMATLESLVTGVGNLIQALAPLGGVALASLKVIGDILAGIPTDVLTLLVSGALGAYAAFSAWSALIPIIQSFGVMLNMSLGPIGLVVAGVGALIGVMVGSAAATNDATAATSGYMAALVRDNGIIAENVRAHAAEEIAKSAAADAAEKLGVSLDTVTSAALGNKNATAELESQMQGLLEKSKESRQGALGNSESFKQWSENSMQLNDAISTLRGEIGNQNSALNNSLEGQRRFNEAMGDTNTTAGAQASQLSILAGMYGTSVANVSAMEDAERKSADQLAQTTLQMQYQNQAGDLLKAALDRLSGKSLSFAEAQNGFEKQLVSATKALDAQKNAGVANATALNGNSEAAINNRGSLLQQVQAAQNSAEAYGQLTGKSSDATAKLKANRDALINNATAAGMNRDEVIKFVDSVMKIPAVKPTKIELDAAAAIQRAQYLKSIIDGTNSKTVYLHAETSVGGPGGKHTVGTGQNGLFATGGMVNYLADGGFPSFTAHGTDTVPAMLTPGEIVMRKSSVDAIGASTLLHANRTGQLPGGGGGDTNVTVMIGDEAIDPRMVRIVNHTLDKRSAGAARNRGGRP